MNAKELIEAAERMNEEWNTNRIASEDLQAVVNHILSTVRPDDDEPVTRERLEADGCGMKKRVTELGNVYFSLPGSLMAYHPEKNRLFLNGGSVELKVKSIGHLRRLVEALGE